MVSGCRCESGAVWVLGRLGVQGMEGEPTLYEPGLTAICSTTRTCNVFLVHGSTNLWEKNIKRKLKLWNNFLSIVKDYSIHVTKNLFSYTKTYIFYILTNLPFWYSHHSPWIKILICFFNCINLQCSDISIRGKQDGRFNLILTVLSLVYQEPCAKDHTH